MKLVREITLTNFVNFLKDKNQTKQNPSLSLYPKAQVFFNVSKVGFLHEKLENLHSWARSVLQTFCARSAQYLNFILNKYLLFWKLYTIIWLLRKKSLKTLGLATFPNGIYKELFFFLTPNGSCVCPVCHGPKSPMFSLNNNFNVVSHLPGPYRHLNMSHLQ